MTITALATLESISSEPSSIVFRCTIPRDEVLPLATLKALSCSLEGFFLQECEFIGGIASFHFTKCGDADTFQERVRRLIEELRIDISINLRFALEFEF